MSNSKTAVPTVKLHPAQGCRVRHKDGRLFNEQGEEVPASSFYLRKVDSGDLLEGMKAKPRAKANNKKGEIT